MYGVSPESVGQRLGLCRVPYKGLRITVCKFHHGSESAWVRGILPLCSINRG